MESAVVAEAEEEGRHVERRLVVQAAEAAVAAAEARAEAAAAEAESLQSARHLLGVSAESLVKAARVVSK